ncbi:MAG: PilZ domain-containing protein [Burkholderiales bacterium]
MKDDNRSNVRKVVTLKARVLLAQGRVVDGRTHDLSMGGLSLLLAAPLPPQATVQVAIQLTRAAGQVDVLTGRATVVFQVLRGEDYQIGLKWSGLDERCAALLHAFLEPVKGAR